MHNKPRLRYVDGQPVEVPSRETPVQAARRRHAKPFAHEPGSDYRPHDTPVLTRWMQNGGANKERK